MNAKIQADEAKAAEKAAELAAKRKAEEEAKAKEQADKKDQEMSDADAAKPDEVEEPQQ